MAYLSVAQDITSFVQRDAIVNTEHSKKHREKWETWPCVEASAAEAQCDNPCCQSRPAFNLQALTHLHKLSFHVSGFGVVASERTRLCCAVLQGPIRSSLQIPPSPLPPLPLCTPNQLLTDSGSSLSDVMPERDRSLKEKKRKIHWYSF